METPRYIVVDTHTGERFAGLRRTSTVEWGERDGVMQVVESRMQVEYDHTKPLDNDPESR